MILKTNSFSNIKCWSLAMVSHRTFPQFKSIVFTSGNTWSWWSFGGHCLHQFDYRHKYFPITLNIFNINSICWSDHI